tara:strand:- start:4365 stop:4919 length:555 start_codon:yes stop_codon:yes gene_type:complete
MKGWKETYTNIVLSEQPNQRKLLRVARDLDKAIDKTGDLIKQIPEEMEMINGDFSESYQELNSGQNSLEYGIRHLEGDIRDYFKEEVKEQPVKEEISERLDSHKKSSAELKGAQFDRKKEINNIKKMIKGLEKLHKEHEKFQYNNRTTSGDRVFRGLYKAEDALYTYMLEIERGEWDGKVELES